MIDLKHLMGQAEKRGALVVFIISMSLLSLPWPVIAATRITLHVTQEELDIWKARAANGPYKNNGDVSLNSPGDWARILSKADAFLSNPSGDRWRGQETAECLKLYNSPGYAMPLPERNRQLGEKLRDAGFAFLVTGDTRYRDAVRGELLAQAQEIGTDFTDSVRWCFTITGDANPTFDITAWLTKILFGYSYIRHSLSAVDQQILDDWFLNAGFFWEKRPSDIVRNRFPNRDQDDYTQLGPGWNLNNPTCTYGECITHFNGWNKYNWHEAWNNRGASEIRFAALVGALLNNNFLKESGKRYVKEWLKYAVFSDNMDSEFHRWRDDIPALGFGYTGGMLGSMVTIADHLARTGDMELYEYTTSEGLFGTEGGVKSLKGTILHYQDYVDHTLLRYGTDQASRAGDPLYLIDSEYEPLNWHSIGDVWLAPIANVYYQNNHIKDVYMRTAPNTPAYPSKPATGGFNAWGGEQGIYPGVLFMFGDMENKVWPYSSTIPPVTSQITLAASPGTIQSGESVTLTWTTENATQCTASGGWSGNKALNGSEGMTPLLTTNYTLTCTGDSGQTAKTVTVTVMPSDQEEQVIGDATYAGDSGNLTTLNRESQNLWDGDTVNEDGSTGAEGIASFFVDFDLGQVRDLTRVRLFGDNQGTWVCTNWTLQTRSTLAESWTQAHASSCGVRQWFEGFLSQNARYLRLNVEGSSGGTQAFELEVYANRKATDSVPPQRPKGLQIVK